MVIAQKSLKNIQTNALKELYREELFGPARDSLISYFKKHIIMSFT
jgi:hypothetical protein